MVDVRGMFDAGAVESMGVWYRGLFNPWAEERYINKMKRSHIMLKDFPKDLALTIILTLSCIPFVLIPPLNETPVRIVLGLLLVLFLPGYSLIAALFPGKDDLDGIERIALSFGLSIAVVPLLGLVLNYTPFGIRLVPILSVLSIFTVSLAVVAYVRRCGLLERDRFVIEVGGHV